MMNDETAQAACAGPVEDPLHRAHARDWRHHQRRDVDQQRAFDLIAQQRVRVLHNEVVQTQGLQLVGLDYMNADEDTFDMHPSDDKRTIKSLVADLRLQRDLPSVLMHHSPVGAPSRRRDPT